MNSSSFLFGESGKWSVHRLLSLALIGVLLLNTAGASGIVAAQQGNATGNNTTAGNSATSSGGNATTKSPQARVNATIQEFKNQDLGWGQLTEGMKGDVRSNLLDLAKNGSNMSKSKRKKKVQAVSTMASDQGTTAVSHIQDIIADRIGVNPSGTINEAMFSNLYNQKPASKTPKGPVNATIQEWKRKDIGYENASQKNKTEIRGVLTEINKSGNISDNEKAQYIDRLSGLMAGGSKDQMALSS